MKSLIHLSAIELRNAFVQGEVSAEAIATHFLARIQKFDPKLRSFLSVLEERALIKAKSLDHKRSKNQPLGKLAGIPIAIKDNMHIAGENTTCASKFLEHYKAPFDASAVRFLEEEDALLLGKTNLDEFAMGSSTEHSAYFSTNNPWNLRCVPGGSSGGSAAAVSARLALLGTGSDTGGSIRQPASFCGIVGFKPTYGRVSRYGLVAFGSSLDQIGPLANTVSDCALAMEVMGKPCLHDATCSSLPQEPFSPQKNLKGAVIGIPESLLEDLAPDIQKNFREAIDVMRSLGARTMTVDLDLLKTSIAVYYILATAEASTNLARFDGIRYGKRSAAAKTLEEIYEYSRKEGFGREVKRRIMLGTFVLSAGYQDAYYRKAQKVRAKILSAFQNAYALCDAIAMPVTTSGAFETGAIQDPVQMYLQDIFTVPANLGGLPAISVPSGYDKNHLPLGLQLIGAQMSDARVMQYAYAYEQATHWVTTPPFFTDGGSS